MDAGVSERLSRPLLRFLVAERHRSLDVVLCNILESEIKLVGQLGEVNLRPEELRAFIRYQDVGVRPFIGEDRDGVVNDFLLERNDA